MSLQKSGLFNFLQITQDQNKTKKSRTPFCRHWKNNFILTTQVTLNVCPDFSVMQQNELIKKVRLISNFMTSKPGKQTIVMHKLSNISRSKDNPTTKFGQLIEYIMKKIFLEKSCEKYGGETSLRPFSGKIKRAYLWISSLKFCTVCFYCIPS